MLPLRELSHSTPGHATIRPTQLALSRHYWNLDGQLRTFSSTHRYAWPAELDLMARIAGLRLRHRWSDWHRAPFTGESRNHISVWEKPVHP